MIKYQCNKPKVTWEDINAVEKVLTSGNLAQGSVTHFFEEKMAELTNRNWAVAMCNATAVFESLFELILSPGDKVVVCPYTWKSVIHSIIRSGGVPVFIDANLNYLADWNKMPIDDPKAIIVTHLFGYPDNNVIEIARRYPGAIIIEDCAQALGAKYDGFNVGDSVSDFAIYSFYATKNICAGEGGVIVGSSPLYLDYLRAIRNNGVAATETKVVFGTNRRITDIQSAIACSQLSRLDEITELRNTQAEIYNAFLPESVAPMPIGPKDVHAFHHYTTDVPPERRSEIIKEMQRHGIQLGIYYDPLFPGSDDCEIAHLLSKISVSLPLGPALSNNDIVFIAKKFSELL